MRRLSIQKLFVLFFSLIFFAGCRTAVIQPYAPASPGDGAQAASLPDDWSPVEQKIATLINGQRRLHRLAPLRPDARLHRAAVLHSAEMAAHSYLGHQGPRGQGFSTRITGQGYRWRKVGEDVALEVLKDQQADLALLAMFGTYNLAKIRDFCRSHRLPVPRTWDQVGTKWNNRQWDAWEHWNDGNGGWMGSAGHRHNILMPDFTDLGVGHRFKVDGAGYSHHYFTADFAVGDS